MYYRTSTPDLTLKTIFPMNDWLLQIDLWGLMWIVEMNLVWEQKEQNKCVQTGDRWAPYPTRAGYVFDG